MRGALLASRRPRSPTPAVASSASPVLSSTASSSSATLSPSCQPRPYTQSMTSRCRCHRRCSRRDTLRPGRSASLPLGSSGSSAATSRGPTADALRRIVARKLNSSSFMPLQAASQRASARLVDVGSNRVQSVRAARRIASWAEVSLLARASGQAGALADMPRSPDPRGEAHFSRRRHQRLDSRGPDAGAGANVSSSGLNGRGWSKRARRRMASWLGFVAEPGLCHFGRSQEFPSPRRIHCPRVAIARWTDGAGSTKPKGYKSSGAANEETTMGFRGVKTPG